MKVYTKTGDKGTTSLYDGNRAPKFIIIFKLLGEIDELSSRIGMLTVHSEKILENDDMKLSDVLRKVQRTLQDFNSYIATVEQKNKKLPNIEPDLVNELEEYIDKMESENSKLTKFILPGVTLSDAQAHLCRTQARTSERTLCELLNTSEILTVRKKDSNYMSLEDFYIPDVIPKYMNRLSDFFFVFARYICKIQGVEDYLM